MAIRGVEVLLRQLPKVDLHVHLDGSVRAQTIADLARDQGVELPISEGEDLLPYIQVSEECGSLREYLSKFDFVVPFLQSEEALERVAYEIVQHSAEHNCRYVEVRFAPQLHRRKGLTAEAAIRSVIDGLRRGEKEYGVRAKVIAICMRNHSSEENLEVVEAAGRFIGKGVAAIDLAGDEAGYPPQLFRDVFAASRARGIPVTIHAGEAGGADNVYEAVTHLGAVRIGHGVRLKENPAIFDMIRKRQVPLEMCPVSNIQTKAVSGWDAYPIREYFDSGVMVTINTDNPSVSGTNITKEYEMIVDKFGFSLEEIAALIMNGVEASFLEDEEKLALRQEFRLQLKELGIDLK
ncbi:adenosine deaminase [Paenibacillus sp. UNC451MF]|uniref:adenosine deaminase n=1 Tax=Paenibacillus sp. UNC451MF TaxID=1449063 RepID=UPI00048ED583|nr:adenosine deaminase [Paenibacillus sp. UNC451MF]